MRRLWICLLLAGCGDAPESEADAGAPALRTQWSATADGWVVEIARPAGTYRVRWTVTGAGSTFRLEPPGRAPIGPVALAVAPPDGPAAQRASLFLLGADLAANGASGQPLTATGLVGNHAGCDDIDVTPGLISCGRGPFRGKGGCCDVHDACISAHCTGCNDSGNVVKCLRPGGTWDCSAACTACHEAVLACFLDVGEHGESACCARGDCGVPQQCLVDDVVVTDACACSEAGVASVDGCAPCVANGAPATPDAPCCSGLTCGATCCGAPGAAGACAADGDCREGAACAEGRCCAPAGAAAGDGACLCCSGRADAGRCL